MITPELLASLLGKHSSQRTLSAGLPAVLGVVFAIGMTWPLLLHVERDIVQDVYDPLLNTWQIAWIGHAVLEQPLNLFDANRCWPEPDCLAFTDVMLGYAPAGVVAAQGPQAALVIHNLLFLFTYALAFLGAYLLARELGASRLAAVVGGAAFAYAPFRLAQNRHLVVLSSGGIPLALFFLVRGYRRGDPGFILAGWLVATWQVTLGFTLGLQLAYLLLVLATAAAVVWFRRGRPPLGAAVIRASALGICVLAAVTVFQAQPFLRVLHDHPEAERTPKEVALYSPPPRGFLAAPPESFLWGGPTAGTRASLRAPIEQTLFPGVAVVALALLGLVSRSYPLLLRFWLAAGTLICGVLSLGLPDFDDPEGGFTPYRFLFDYAPGWDGFRTPGRINTLTSLGLALLATAGAMLLLHYVGRRRAFGTPSARRAATLVTAGLLTAVVLLEGFGPVPHPRVPPLPAGQIGAPAPQLHLPSDELLDPRYAYWSVAGFPKLANGGGAAFLTTGSQALRRVTTTFPDAESVAALRRLGVRTVILHPDLAFGTPWQDLAMRPVEGLPLVREDRLDVILYHLQPEPRST